MWNSLYRFLSITIYWQECFAEPSCLWSGEMRSLSCCCEISFSCLAEKISFPESNPAGAMEERYQWGSEKWGAWPCKYQPCLPAGTSCGGCHRRLLSGDAVSREVAVASISDTTGTWKICCLLRGELWPALWITKLLGALGEAREGMVPVWAQHPACASTEL